VRREREGETWNRTRAKTRRQAQVFDDDDDDDDDDDSHRSLLSMDLRALV
jgi:hypothetical protein